MKELVYLDNASTTFPKPAEVCDYMYDFYQQKGVSPGRACSSVAAEVVQLFANTRESLCRFFNCGERFERMVFTYNATDSLNMAIQGLLKKGDHVISTMLEHNAVLRPIHHLMADGIIEADFVSFDENGYIDPDDIRMKIKSNTKLVSVVHGSNVIGTVQPIAEVGAICRRKGVVFLSDVSQTAGVIPIDMEAMNLDIIAFPGHKSLYGPTGIGGMFVRDGIEVQPIRYGGTGIRSEDRFHIMDYPYRLEAGTGNILGVAGLFAGQHYVTKSGIDNIYNHEMALFSRLNKGLQEIKGVKIYCADESKKRLPVLSMNLGDKSSTEIGDALNVRYNISTRPGLHCAPKLHERIGTFDSGTVRFGLGALNTVEEIDLAIQAVRELADELD